MRTQRSHIGTEPPLTLTANSRAALRRGSVNLRWLAGAFMTGIFGAGLIGGALLTSVEGTASLNQPLETWSVAETPDIDLGLGDRNSSSSKSDKLDVARKSQISRKVIQTTAVRRVAEKEFISIRPYEIVSIPLALSATEISSELPPFNPLKIFADGGLFAADEEEQPVEAVQTGTLVSVSVTDFADAGEISFAAEIALPESEVEAVVRSAVPFDENIGLAFQAPDVPAAMAGGLAFSDLTDPSAVSDGDLSTIAAIDNESIIAKTPADTVLLEADALSVLTVAPGDTLSNLLLTVGIDSGEARVIANAIRPVFRPEDLQPGQQLHLALKKNEDQNAIAELLRMSVFSDGNHLATVRKNLNDGAFVTLDASADIVRPVISATSVPAGGKRASIYAGLYEAGIAHEIPRVILNRIVQVHSYDVDFQKAVQPGDHFVALFELEDDSSAAPDPLPLYIAMDIRGSERGFYKFRTPDDGVVDYYDVDGNSAKKFLIRKPLNGGRFRSGFGKRRHPILRTRRMHWGVDWAAPRGTPIVAAGNGTIVEAKWKSGYGNWVKLRHANGYETNYGHMTRHAKGMKAGIKVRQGQVIGYVGSTGLSTGPHLHYEVEVNKRKVDPLRIRLPRGRVLQAEVLAEFEQERDRIDALMAKPPAQSTVAHASVKASGKPDQRQIARR